MSEKINILFSSFPDYSGNPKAFYEFLNSNYKSKFNLNWVIYDKTIFILLKSQAVNCVLFNSSEYNELMKKINIIFDTHGALLSEKKQNQIYINQWHGFGPKKSGYFLENLSEQDSNYLSIAKNKTDYIIVPSEFARLVFASIFNVNIKRVIASGFCRDDYILYSDGKANLQKLTNYNVYSYNKIIFYLPTFRNGLNRNDSKGIFLSNLLNLEQYTEKDLTNFLADHNYLLVIKKHPSEENLISNIVHPNILVLNDISMTEKFITIHEILNAADLLISDYSSIYVEYLLLDKPVLFLHRDIDEYLDKRGIILNNSELWFPGPKPNTLNEFINATQKLLNQKKYFSMERCNFRKLMLSENKCMCQSLFDFLFDYNNFTLKHKPYISELDQLKKSLNKTTNQIENLNTQIYNLRIENKDIQKINNNLNNENTILKSEINRIYDSKSWKILQKFQRIKAKLRQIK